MSQATLPKLPDTALLPRCNSWADAELQERVLARAVTLFQPTDHQGDPDRGYKIEGIADETGQRDRLFVIWKPGAVDPAEENVPYSPRYVYDSVEQTCSCPFFSGIDPAHWSDTFRVIRDGRRIVVTDREGKVITPDKPAHGYCKHHWGALLHFLEAEASVRRQAVSVPDDRDI